MKFLKALYEIIINPGVLDKYKTLEQKFGDIHNKNSILHGIVEGYEENIKDGLLIEVPNKIRGDVIYYIANGTAPSEKLLKHAIATVYGDKTRCIIEITVDYYVIKNRLLYIVTKEDPDTLIYVKNPMLFDTVADAFKYIRDISANDISVEVVTEFINKNNVTVDPNIFTYPCEIGTTIYHALIVNDKLSGYSEGKVIGFNIREDCVEVVIYSEDAVALDIIEIGSDGLKDKSWSFTKPE